MKSLPKANVFQHLDFEWEFSMNIVNVFTFNNLSTFQSIIN